MRREGGTGGEDRGWGREMLGQGCILPSVRTSRASALSADHTSRTSTGSSSSSDGCSRTDDQEDYTHGQEKVTEIRAIRGNH